MEKSKEFAYFLGTEKEFLIDLTEVEGYEIVTSRVSHPLMALDAFTSYFPDERSLKIYLRNQGIDVDQKICLFAKRGNNIIQNKYGPLYSEDIRKMSGSLVVDRALKLVDDPEYLFCLISYFEYLKDEMSVSCLNSIKDYYYFLADPAYTDYDRKYKLNDERINLKENAVMAVKDLLKKALVYICAPDNIFFATEEKTVSYPDLRRMHTFLIPHEKRINLAELNKLQTGGALTISSKDIEKYREISSETGVDLADILKLIRRQRIKDLQIELNSYEDDLRKTYLEEMQEFDKMMTFEEWLEDQHGYIEPIFKNESSVEKINLKRLP